MARVIIYARVSTDEAAQATSIPNQQARCADYCRAMRHEVVAQISDEGLSAKTMERPGWKQVVAMLKDDGADLVLATSLDRMSRTVSGFLAFVEETLTPTGKSFATLQEQIDTSTAAGRMLLTVLLGFAQFQREQTAEKITGARLARARQGYWTTKPPFGTCTGTVKGIPEMDAREWSVVERIFALAADRVSDAEILRDEAVAASGIRGTTLARVLSSRFYLGEVEFNGEWFPALHACRIDGDLWQRAQKDRQQRPGRKTKPGDYLLEGLLVTSHYKDAKGRPAKLYCYPLSNGKGGRFPSYKLSRPNEVITPADDLAERFPAHISAYKVDNPVVDFLVTAAEDPLGPIAHVLRETRAEVEAQRAGVGTEITAAERLLRELEIKRQRLQDRAGRYMLNDDEERLGVASRELARLRKDIDTASAKLQGLRDAATALQAADQEPELLAENLNLIRRARDVGDREALRLVLHGLIDRVDVRLDGLAVTMRPLSGAAKGMSIAERLAPTGIEPVPSP